jgi:MscS family membrane protein
MEIFNDETKHPFKIVLTQAFCALMLIVGLFQPPLTYAAKENPLKPPDTSSPRATLTGFLARADEIGRVATQYKDSPTWENAVELSMNYFSRARHFLNLSELATTAQIQAGNDALTQLWEVLSRIELPPTETIPDAASMDAQIAQGKPARWTISNTEIVIEKIKEGSRTGEYLFSPETVGRIGEFYDLTAQLPYVRKMTLDNPYQTMLLWGGWMFPPNVIGNLPSWLKFSIGNQLLWKWLALLVLIGGAFTLVWLIRRWTGRVTQSDTMLKKYARPLAAPITVLLLSPLIIFMVHYQIVITGAGITAVQFLVPAAIYLACAWLIWYTTLFIAEFIISSLRIPDQGPDAHLLRLVAQVISLLGVGSVLFWGGNQLGIPLYGLIAGVSLGGLAVALASQGTLENFLGSINLFLDRPVRVGDVCKYGNAVGMVEVIGLRSTRLRGLDRTVTTVPNAAFSKMEITNLTMRDRMLIKTVLGLRYETTPDQLRYLLEKLREMLIAHPQILKESMYVRFVGFSDFSLNIEINAYIGTQKYQEFLRIQEDIFLRIIDVAAAAGTGFAFPKNEEALQQHRFDNF